MLLDAALLATLTGMSLILLYKKLPARVKQFLVKHPLLVDALAMCLTLGALGTSLTALMAGAMVDVVLGIAMYIAEHPDDFLYLYDAWNMLQTKMNEAKKVLNDYGAQYRNQKAMTQSATFQNT